MNCLEAPPATAIDAEAQLWTAVAQASQYGQGESVYAACRELHLLSVFLLTADRALLAEGLPRGAPFYGHLDSIVEALNTEGVMRAVLALEEFIDGMRLREKFFD